MAVGTGTVVNKTSIKQYQQATRDRSSVKTEGGKIIRVEAHPIPEHPRPRRCKGRVALVGDAAGYVTKCSGADGGTTSTGAASFLARASRTTLLWTYSLLQNHSLQTVFGSMRIAASLAHVMCIPACRHRRHHDTGEGIYFAAKSGRMCAEAIVEGSARGKKMIGEKDLRVYLDKCVLRALLKPACLPQSMATPS